LTQIIEFILLGLGPGALIAGLALSILLTYRGTGAINFAAGTIAVFAAYVFYGLKTGGYLFFSFLSFGGPWAVGPSVAVAIAVSVLIGVITEYAVWRPMRRSPPLAKLLASLGIFITLQSIIVLRFGSTGQLAPPVFQHLGNTEVNILGASVPGDRLALFGIIVVIAATLWALYRYTRFGLSTRAAQESEEHAILAGLSPSRLSLTNTILAAAVAGGLGVLAASQTQLDAMTIPLTVIPALGAALLANFTSFPIAMAAGVGLGILESELTYAQSLNWFPTDLGRQPLPGVSDLLFFLVIVAATLWRGASLPDRGTIAERRLPPAPAPKRVARPAGISLAVLVVAFLVLPFDFRQALTNSLIGIVVCLSLVVIIGFVGQISLLQVALAGVSGFVISKLSGDVGIGFPLGLIIGVIAAVAFGLITALPALRIRGVNLAIVTLAGAQALYSFGFEDARWGGGLSTLPVRSPHLFALNLGPNADFPINGGVPSPAFGLVCAVAAILCAMLVAAVRRSGLGRQMLAVRSNERAAAAAGISVPRVKLKAFGLSSGIAGLAGGLYAYNFGAVSAAQFSLILSLTFISFAYIGGITSVRGAILAGAGVTEGILGHVLDKWVGIPGDWQVLIGGVFLVVVLVRSPGGLAALPPPWHRLTERRRGRGSAAPRSDLDVRSDVEPTVDIVK
jgi:branched-chain amino acid transport system permease protein